MVLVLIGIILSFVTLTTSGTSPRERMQEEAVRLGQLLRMLREEAILQTGEFALEKTETGYRFDRLVAVQADQGADTSQSTDAAQRGPQWKWAPIENDALFRARELDPDIQLRLTLEGVSPRADPQDEAQRVYFSPSGEITPFELELVDRNGTDAVRLRGEATGEISQGGPAAADGTQ